MDRIFNMDNKFFVFMGRVADLILLNLYFVVSCIPIITIGPALTALHYVTMKMVKNEESYIFREYVKSFKQNFRQGVIINIIMIFTALLLFLDIRLVNSMAGSMARVLYCIFLAIGILYFMIWLYVYPVLAKFYNSIRNTFTNAFLMSIRHLPYTVLLALICIAPVAMVFLPSAQILNMLVLVFVLCGFSLIAFCNSFFYVKIFEKYIPKEETPASEETGLEEILTDEALPDGAAPCGAAAGTVLPYGAAAETALPEDAGADTASVDADSGNFPSGDKVPEQNGPEGEAAEHTPS